MYNKLMVFTHAFAGAVTTRIYLNSKKSNNVSKDLLYFLGILGSVLPDFDIAVIFFFPELLHRYFVTHSIVLYGGLFLVTYLTAKTIKNKTLEASSCVLFLGLLTHIFFDIVTGGTALFAPFLPQLIGLRINLPAYTPEDMFGWVVAYTTSFYGIAEAALFGLYAYILRNEDNKIGKILPWIFLLIAIATLGMLIILYSS